MKKKPKTIPFEFRDPKLPEFGTAGLPLDISDAFPGQALQNVLPQQPQPVDVLPGNPPQMW